MQDPPAEAGWEHFPHDADIGVCGWGPDAARAFEQAALAMTAAVTDAVVAPDQEVALTCEAPDLEILLVEWLNALVFEMATRGMLFGRFEVTIDGTRLSAQVWGEPVDRERHAPAVEVKGATYTELSVAQDAAGTWRAQCVIDV